MSGSRRTSAASRCSADQTVRVVLDLQQRLSDALPGKVLKRALLNATLLAHAGLLETLGDAGHPTSKPLVPCCVEHRPDGGVRLE